MGRSSVRTVLVALSAVLVWQATFVAPTPVVAADPLPPGYIDCGLGFVCGGPNPNVPPSGNIEVTGPEDRVVQDTSFDINDPNDISAAAAWGPLEVEAEAAVAELHGVDIDSRLTDFARDDIRAFMFSRLLAIASEPPASRTAMEETALDKFVSLVKERHVLAAQNGVNEYARWLNSPCSYTWPAGIGAAPYVSGAVELVCDDHDPNTNPASPDADAFAAIGATMAFSNLASDPSATSIAGKTGASIAGLAMFSEAAGLATSAILGATGATAVGGASTAAVGAAAATLANPAVAALTAEAIANPAVAAVEIANPAVAAIDIANPAVVIPEAASAVSALTVAAVVAIAIFALVTIAIQTWQFVEQATIPDKLAQKLSDAQAQTPDVVAMTKDPANLFQLLMIFASETLPDYPDQRPAAVDAHASADPDFARTLHLLAGIPPQPFDIPLPPSNTINPVDWDGTDHTVYMSNGWFVDQPEGGAPHYSLSIQYVNWAGEHWRASVAGNKFIHTRDGYPNDAFEDSAVDYVDAVGLMEVERHSNRPPTININSDATSVIHEGDTVHFHADVSDPDAALPGGDPMTLHWLVEPASRESDPIVIVDGQSSLDRCYTEPAGPSSIDGLVGINSDCPWDKFSGADVTYTYHDNNVANQPVLHVRAIVTDSHGASASQILVLNVASVDPTLTLDAPTTHSVFDGDKVTVTGSFSDAGNDQETVTIDWGDGSTTGKAYPCAWVDFSHNPLGLTQCIFGAQSAGHPTSFSLEHVYHLAPAETSSHYQAIVTLTDDDFAWDSDTETVDVAPRAGLPSLFPVGHDFGSVTVGQTASYAFALNNIGNGDLDVSGFHIAGTGASSFSVGTENCTASALVGGGACVVWVNFTPTATGARHASLVVDAEVSGAPESVPLTGFGVSMGTITVIEDSVPNSSNDFTFDRDGPGGAYQFRLDDAAGSSMPRSRTATNLPAGTYTLGQHEIPSWDLRSIDCGAHAATINLAELTVTFDVADGDHVTCTFTDARIRPDGLVARANGGPFVGNNVYRTKPTSGQTLTRSIGHGSSSQFWVRLQNDAAVNDALGLIANEQGSSRLSMTYTVNGADVTSQVLAGTFVTASLAPGAWLNVKVTVAVAANAGFASNRSAVLKVSSVSKPTVFDVVRLRAVAL